MTHIKFAAMHSGVLSLLRCPVCSASLTLSGAATDDVITNDTLTCPCGEAYRIDDGVPNLVVPRDQQFILEDPETYDELMTFIARLLRADEPAARRKAVAALDISAGARVLEVGCGPGSNFSYLFDAIGPTGEIYAVDISAGMIRQAGKRPVLVPDRRHFFLANGVHLPFPDESFDAVLQLGTLNRFADIPAALREMARVTRRGGKVVAGDEGLGAWLRDTDYAALLNKFGALFQGQVPIGSLPLNAQDVTVRWDLGQAYYFIEFRVGDAPSPDLDVKLPGRDVTVREVLEQTRARST